MSAPAASEPSRSIEIERKYDAADATPVPDWSALPGVARIGDAEVRELDARYFDTADLSLAQARVALRRREGGPDAGWHVKASGADGRTEWGWPLALDAADAVVPAPIVDAVAEWAKPPFEPLARIRNTRTAYALLDADGGMVAEFVDDRVRGVNERADAEHPGAQTSWREWEVELGPAAPAADDAREAFFAAVDAAVAAAGGHPAASDSKLGRVLGH